MKCNFLLFVIKCCCFLFVCCVRVYNFSLNNNKFIIYCCCCVFIFMSVCLSIRLSVFSCVRPSVCPCIVCLFVKRKFHLNVIFFFFSVLFINFSFFFFSFRFHYISPISFIFLRLNIINVVSCIQFFFLNNLFNDFTKLLYKEIIKKFLKRKISLSRKNIKNFLSN